MANMIKQMIQPKQRQPYREATWSVNHFYFGRLHVGFRGLLWIISGGLAYTSGVAFYLAKRLAYSHLIWHLFVSAGTACHFCAVLWYAG